MSATRTLRPRMLPVTGLSVRLRSRRVFVSLAGGHYWATGATRDRWTAEARLPFLHVGATRLLGHPRVRLTFMGWRGVDHVPSPDFRQWTWPSGSGERSTS